MRKILVLTGSPRVMGNSDMMAEAFIAGAKSKGSEIMRFDAGRRDIMTCKACGTCFSKGKACSFNDDFDELAEMLIKADAIVIATPIYWYTFPAGLKAAIDKFCSFYFAKKELKIKESMLLLCGETQHERDFEGIIRTYEIMAELLNWNDRGHYIVTGVNNRGDIRSTDALADLIKMGEEF